MTGLPTRPLHPLRRLAAWIGVGAVLAAVFAAWLDPDLAFALATRAWACL